MNMNCLNYVPICVLNNFVQFKTPFVWFFLMVFAGELQRRQVHSLAARPGVAFRALEPGEGLCPELVPILKARHGRVRFEGHKF